MVQQGDYISAAGELVSLIAYHRGICNTPCDLLAAHVSDAFSASGHLQVPIALPHRSIYIYRLCSFWAIV